jgi:hypothetical protein
MAETEAQLVVVMPVAVAVAPEQAEAMRQTIILAETAA